MPITADVQKQIELLQASLGKKYGEGTIRVLGGNEVANIKRISTGVPSVDWAIGGGLPEGRMVEIYGPESSGKTTVCLHCIAEHQKQGGIAAIIDAEHALDLAYARSLGVDVNALIVNQPDTAEEALDIVDQLVDSGIVTLIVVDSVAALTPKAELEGDMGAQLPGLQARLMSQACRKLTASASNNGVTIIWINQIRYKIGVMFGSPETTSGGNALKFYCSVRMDIRRKGQVKVGEEAVANETTIKVVKNKTAPPYREADFQIDFGKGVNKVLDLVRIASDKGIITKSGAWFSYGTDRLGQGEKNVSEFLREHPKLLEEITEKLRQNNVGELSFGD